jgi:Fur family zinc uptake transcriptional regulator
VLTDHSAATPLSRKRDERQTPCGIGREGRAAGLAAARSLRYNVATPDSSPGSNLRVTPEQVEIALARAQRICTLRGARLTPIQRVLELILRADQPTKVYALLAELEQERGRLGPPTVYRALDFLLAHKLTHRVETSNAFVACGDAEHSHQSQFVICDDCGATEEIQDDEIVASLRRLGEKRGFAVERQVIEARGLCPSCRTAQRQA